MYAPAMKVKCAAIAVGLALLGGGCGSSSGEPKLIKERQLNEVDHGKVPALLVDRWAVCFEGLDEGSIAREGDGNRYTALVGDQMYSWRVSKGNTGGILTFPEEETAALAEDCD